MILWQHLRRKMLQHATQVVLEKNAKMTYEELVIFAESLSEKLKGERCCAIYCESELSCAMALLGCFAANVTAVPLSYRYGEKHCEKILKHISPTCVITENAEGLGIYQIEDSEYLCPAKRPALIMYTSGTRGIPKGAMLSETAIITNVTDIGDYYALSESDTLLIARPLYHCAVLTGEFLTALTKGTKIVFCSENFNPTQLLSLMKEQSVTAFGSTPTVLRTLARFAKAQGSPSLRHLVISGECLSEGVARTIRDAFPKTSIYHVYGLTEASPRVAFLPPDQFDQFPESVGQPLNSVQLQIRNPNGTQAPNGTEGILWVRGKNVMQGYYKNLAKTRATLQKGWLCTGDIAVIERNGWLKIKGRNDDLIIRSGMNIYPAEIEGELKQDSRTRDALIYKIENEKHGTQIGLRISGDFLNEREVREMCSSLLAPYQMPNLIDLVENLPHNGSGKTVRKHD